MPLPPIPTQIADQVKLSRKDTPDLKKRPAPAKPVVVEAVDWTNDVEEDLTEAEVALEKIKLDLRRFGLPTNPALAAFPAACPEDDVAVAAVVPPRPVPALTDRRPLVGLPTNRGGGRVAPPADAVGGTGFEPVGLGAQPHRHALRRVVGCPFGHHPQDVDSGGIGCDALVDGVVPLAGEPLHLR